MLSNILAISGKTGLFKLVSSTTRIIIVESLIDGKRTQVRPDAKVISLKDIAIYTDEKEVPLQEVLKAMKEQNKGEKTISHKEDESRIREVFAAALPDYDKDRVYLSDMRKVIQWYNQLQENNLLDFKDEKEAEDSKE